MKRKSKTRFEVILHEPDDDGGSGFKVIEDTETGISYLYHYGEGGAGLTVLLDEEGDATPMINEKNIK